MEEDAPSSAELEKYPLAKRYYWSAKRTLEATPLEANAIELEWKDKVELFTAPWRRRMRNYGN